MGYLEEMLTRRLAEISWRMSRVVRYEADCAAAAVATAETDLDERAEWGSGKPSDPAEAREEFERASEVREALETLSSAPNKQKINKYIAVAVEWALWSELPEGACPISVPGVPDEDEAFEAFDDWTVGLLRQEIEAYARAAQIAPEALRQKCISSASEQCNEAETKERNLVDRSRRWKLKLARETSNRMLLEPAVLSNVADTRAIFSGRSSRPSRKFRGFSRSGLRLRACCLQRGMGRRRSGRVPVNVQSRTRSRKQSKQALSTFQNQMMNKVRQIQEKENMKLRNEPN